MTAIFKREMRTYFTDPLGYVFLTVFVLLCNLSFYMINLKSYISDLSGIFLNIITFSMILIPLMTMRIWSEEKKQKTDQLLLTAPVSTAGVVLGKFLAAWTLFAIGMCFTIVFPILVSARGTVMTSKVIGNYVGVMLIAAAYISISFFVSSLTKSQIVSVICSVLALFAFFGMDLLIGLSSSETVNAVLAFFSMVTRYYNLYMGVFTLADIVYFISLTTIFLFLTSRVIEKQRWS